MPSVSRCRRALAEESLNTWHHGEPAKASSARLLGLDQARIAQAVPPVAPMGVELHGRAILPALRVSLASSQGIPLLVEAPTLVPEASEVRMVLALAEQFAEALASTVDVVRGLDNWSVQVLRPSLPFL
jgi:hypothetical protein